MCFVKVTGIAFLGQPRDAAHAAHAAAAHGPIDCGPAGRIGMAWLAIACFVLGLFPSAFLLLLNRICRITSYNVCYTKLLRSRK